MAQVKLEIGGRSFVVSCQDGEEEHIGKLGAMVDAKARATGDPARLTESRMLLFTSLFLADELHSAKTVKGNEPTQHPPIPAPGSSGGSSGGSSTSKAEQAKAAENERTLVALEKLADRVEAFANSLEQDSNNP